MKSLALTLALAAAVPATAQVHVDIDLPRIVFPSPPTLVVIEPGVQVVEDNDDEVFYVDNWYWHRRGGRWFRNQRHDGNWVVVEEHHVPRTIVKFTPGHYRKFRGHGHGGHKGGVVINPPGPGKIKIKGDKHHGKNK